MGATLTQQIILFEEISRVGAPTPYPHGLNFIGPLIIDAGTPEQKAKHLPRDPHRRRRPGARAIPSGRRLRPRQPDDARRCSTATSFVVNGHKMWTTNGHFADWMFALVRTDRNAKPRHAGISMLLIDLKSPGITVRPIQTIQGDSRNSPRSSWSMCACRARTCSARSTTAGRSPTGCSAPSVSPPAIRATRPCFSTRRGRWPNSPEPRAKPAFLHKLAALEIDLLAFSAYYRHAAALHGERRAPFSMAPVIKIVGGELGQRASELLVEAAGRSAPWRTTSRVGNHVINPAAEMFEMRRVTVGSGAVEIQRNIIAKRVLGLPS